VLSFFHYLRSGDVAEALAGATSSVFGLLRRTRDPGSTETVLIEVQEELVALSQRFAPVHI
jgi:pyridoxine kinase